MPYVLGLGQGVYRVMGAGTSLVVTPPPVMPVAGGPQRVARGDAARRTVALAEFEQRVRTLAREAQ